MAEDVQIRLGDGAAPQSYGVPNATQIVPLAINATFDGTGAAGSFLPTVEIVSDGGVVVARVPCQTTVAAGASAEVTFAPFLRAESGGACGGIIDATATVGDTCGVHSAGQAANLVLTSDGANGSVWAAGGGFSPNVREEHMQQAGQSIAAASSALISWGHYSGNVLMDLTTPTLPKATVRGVYGFSVGMATDAPVTAGARFDFALTCSQASFPYAPGRNVPFSATYTCPADGSNVELAASLVARMDVGDIVGVTIFNAGAAAHTFQGSLSCVKIVEF